MLRKLLVIFVIGAGLWYWHEGSLPFMQPQGVYDSNGSAKILVFTYDHCGGPCDEGIRELEKRGAPFEEIVLDPNKPDSPEMKRWKKLGKGAFPFIVAGDQRVIGTSKAQLATLLASNFGDEFLTSAEIRYFDKHFYTDGTPRIVMYGAEWCPGCKKLRAELNNANIDYLEIDVEKSANQAQLLKTMEINGYPATWVGYTRVNGTDLRAVKKELEKI